MNVIPAIKTMIAIHNTMVADQGASFRQWQKQTLPHLDDAYRGHDDPFRSHLGASVLGDECGRAIWYGFHWATKEVADAQMLRLWNRGHLEEGRFIAMLLMIGCNVVQQDDKGKQFRISFSSGHGGGSGDGFLSNVPDLPPDTWAQAEFKTHNQKSFDELAGKNFREWFKAQCNPKLPRVAFEGKGVRESKPEHYFQMQTYMRKFNLTCAVYGAVCKNTDDVWLEIVPSDAALADQLIDRADKVIWMRNVPEKMKNASAGFWKCRWCNHNKVCHLGSPPAVNCRTCKFSEPIATPDEKGVWQCNHPAHSLDLLGTRPPIPKATQLTGCTNYERGF